MYNNKIIETKAIRILEDKIVSPEIDPHIPNNDKTMSWDGEIFLYKRGTFQYAKEDFLAKFSTQVKGTQKPLGKKLTFPVEVSDLKNYQTSGGVIFFVVDIINQQIYYKELLPVTIEELFLASQKKRRQKKISISVKPFKLEGIDIFNMFYNFTKNSKLQYQSNGYTRPYSSLSEDFHLPIVGKLKFEKENGTPILSSDNMNLYIRHNQYVHEPLSSVIPEKLTMTTPISINFVDKPNTVHSTIENVITSKRSDNYFLLNNQISIYPYRDSPTLSFDLANASIATTLGSIEILEGLLSGNELLLDGKPLGTAEPNIEALPLLRSKKDSLEKITLLLNELDIPVPEYAFSEEDYSFLLLLYNDIYLNKPHERIEGETTESIYIAIGPLKLALVLLVKGNESQYISYFNPCLRLGKTQYPLFLVTERNHLAEASNVNYKSIKETLLDIDFDEDADYLITKFILESLHAYDITHNIEILQMLEPVTKRLFEFTNNNLHYLNYLQVVKRIRCLNIAEISRLTEILNNERDNCIKVAIAILLDSKSDYNTYYSMLSQKEQEEFDNYPIRNLLS